MRSVRQLVPCAVVFVILISMASAFSGCTSPEEENRFLELLKLLPESTIEDECFFLIDYEAMWERNGVEFPEGITNKEGIDDILLESSFADPDNLDGYAVLFSSYYTGWGIKKWISPNISPVQYTYVGYDIPNVAAEIHNGVINEFTWISPPEEPFAVPDQKVAAIGNFSPNDTEKALEYRDEWPDWAVESYTQEQYEDVLIHTWVNGTEPHDFRGTGPPHNLNGVLLPLAVTDNRLFVAESVGDIEDMIDASSGKTTTLADVPEYALLAEGLYELGSYVAIMGDERLTTGRRGPFSDYALKPFLTFGTGYGRDEKGTYIALVLVHENEELASINADIFPKRFAEYGPDLSSGPGTGIYDTYTYADGRVLLSKLYTDDLYFWFLWLTKGFTMLYHGE